MTVAKNDTPDADAQVAEATSTPHDSLALRHRRERLLVSRPALAELTGLSLSRLWAAEKAGKTVTQEHLALIVAALDGVEKNGLPEHLRPRTAADANSGPTRAQLLERLWSTRDLLAAATNQKTVKELRETIDAALLIVSVEPERSK